MGFRCVCICENMKVSIFSVNIIEFLNLWYIRLGYVKVEFMKRLNRFNLIFNFFNVDLINMKLCESKIM